MMAWTKQRGKNPFLTRYVDHEAELTVEVASDGQVDLYRSYSGFGAPEEPDYIAIDNLDAHIAQLQALRQIITDAGDIENVEPDNDTLH